MHHLNLIQKLALITAGMTLSLEIINSNSVQAITLSFDWTGQIAGWRVSGVFSYDGTQSYAGGIVRTGDLDFLNVSFFTPDGTLVRTYTDNHLDPWVNFNFDTQTKQILQAGSFNAPDGISIGAPNYDQQTCFPSGLPSGDPTCGENLANASGLNFWSKPPRSGTPHLHVDDWADEFAIPLGFPPHEEVAFPTRTTQELIDLGRVGSNYLPPNGEPVTPRNERGQFAQVALVPEPTTWVGLLGIGGWLVASAWQRQKH